MNKILLSTSLALGMLTIAPSAVALELDITPSGFVEIIWTLSDGTDLGKYGEENRFETSGELDVVSKLQEGITMRFDADVNPSTGDGDSGRLEQIFLQWDIDQKMSLKGGVFNNRLTFEREDIPDMYQITHGQLWDIWNFSTAEDGNNLQGLEFNIQLNKVNLILGFLNDLNDMAEENSLEIGAEIKASEKFDITLGLITQDQNLESIFDIVARYRTNKFLIAGELLLADELVDNGFMLMTNFKLTQELSATVRYDYVDYESPVFADNTSSLTLAGLYGISKNLFVNAEFRFNDDDNQPGLVPPAATPPAIGEGDGTTARLELLATF